LLELKLLSLVLLPLIIKLFSIILKSLKKEITNSLPPYKVKALPSIMDYAIVTLDLWFSLTHNYLNLTDKVMVKLHKIPLLKIIWTNSMLFSKLMMFITIILMLVTNFITLVTLLLLWPEITWKNLLCVNLVIVKESS
jgi:hypothetical protein